MDTQTRRLLKVYLRLRWLKLHAYYEKLTSIAYAGVLVMNPYRKLPFLKELWQQIPKAIATGYYNDCKRKLAAHWELNYKNREIEDGIEPPQPIQRRFYNLMAGGWITEVLQAEFLSSRPPFNNPVSSY
jgi:hypothetical protein